MITPKDKDEFINSLCKQVQPNAHFNINKPEVEYINFLKILKNRGLLNHFAEHHSVLYMELAPELYEFMDAGGFVKEEEDKKKKEFQMNKPQTIIIQQPTTAKPKLEGTCTNEFIQRKALSYLYKRREKGMVPLNSFWREYHSQPYIKNTLEALRNVGFIEAVNHRTIGNFDGGIEQTVDNVRVTAKITREGKEFYRKEFRDDYILYLSNRIGLLVLGVTALSSFCIWLYNIYKG